MLKYRLIFGILIAAFLVALVWVDSALSFDWPVGAGAGGSGRGWSLPPGFLVALASLAIVPWALWEMRALLARDHVDISMRITVVAATLCMLWPWLEQACDTLVQRHAAVQAGSFAPAPVDGRPPVEVQAELRDRIESSYWFPVARMFRTVKPHYLVPTVLALSLVAAIIKHARHQRIEGAMANAGGTLLAIVYLGVLPGFFLPICMTHSAWMMLAIIAVVKSADIGAYCGGKLLGRRKLIAWLSPGKTVEGFIGGLALACLTGAILASLFQRYSGSGEEPSRWAHLPVFWVVGGGAVGGLILGAVGQLGDLLESLLKRDAGVKDSGRVPGFGGVLDLLDSPLLAAPVAYWLLKIVQPAGV